MSDKNHQTALKNRKIVGIIIFFVFSLVILLMASRYSVIAVSKNVRNVNLSKKTQQLYTQTQTLKAKRGTIYDANNTPISEDTSTYSMYAVLNKNQKDSDGKPLYVVDRHKTAKKLSQYLNLSEKSIYTILNPKNKNAFQVEFGSAGKNISTIVKNKIEKLHLPGINFIQQQSRLYPNGIFASNLIGVALNETDEKTGATKLEGQMGIEKAFNSELSGKDGYKNGKYDVYGYQLSDKSQKTVPAQNGDNIYTTIDYRLQTLLESTVSSVYAQANPSSMNAVLMNAKTGEILAATQRPTFNAGTLKGIGSSWSNNLVEDTYEPGSTMKIFTMASAIDSNNYKGNDYYKSGTYSIDGKIVPDWNTSGWGYITYDKGFALSSNVAMAHLEQKMGAKTWEDYINKFHFLQSTNSGLENEASGSMQFNYPIERADTSFGQGIVVSPMQMMQALTSISNDGTMVKPHVISKIVNPNTDQVVKKYSTQVIGHPISAKTAKEVRKHMEDVVYKDYGIGSDYKIKGYKIAAKTGTAQVSNGSGGYASGDNSYLYSVAGMAPAKDPKFVLYITMKQPKLTGSKTATQLLSEIFKPVMQRALEDSNTPKSETKVSMPSTIYQSVEDAKSSMAKKGLTPVILGNGKVVTKQSIKANTTVNGNTRVLLLTNGTKITMPRIIGWSQSEVKQLGEILGIKVKINGSGYVASQSINSGEMISKNQKLVVNFE